MKKSDCQFIETWDYLGHGGSGYAQSDWNNTFLTKLNYLSSFINKHTFRGGATNIKSHPKYEELFNTMFLYDKETNSFSGRYKVEYDESLDQTGVFLYRELETFKKDGEETDSFIIMPSEETFDSVNNKNAEPIPMLSFKLFEINDDNSEYIEKFTRHSKSFIEIKNYG